MKSIYLPFIAFSIVVLCPTLCKSPGLMAQESHVDSKGESSELRYQAREAFYRRKVSEKDISVQEKKQAYDSLIYYLDLQGKTEEFIAETIKYTNLLSTIGKYTESFTLLERVLEKIKADTSNSTHQEQMRNCLYEMGKATLYLGMYPQSVEYFLELLKYSDNEPNYEVMAYSELSLLFLNMKQESQANYYLNQARTIIAQNDNLNSGTLFSFYNAFAGIKYIEREYDSALILMKLALENIGQVKGNQLSCYYNVGNIYMAIGEIDIAKEYFLKVVENTDNTDIYSYVYTSAFINLGFLNAYLKNNTQSRYYYQKALESAQRIDAKKLQSTIYMELSQVYKDMGDYKTSLGLLEEGIVLKDSVFNNEQIEKINLLSQGFQNRQQELEKDILQQKLEYAHLSDKHQRTIMFILISLMLVFCISFCIALYTLFLQRKKNREEQADRMEETSLLHADTENKSRQLATTNLQLVQAAEIITECKNAVKKLKVQKPSENKETILEMESMLNSFNIDSAWEEFELYFNQIHQSFFKNLYQRCPELSRTEVRICALIVLNLSTKEIATITHRASKTIETSIYQIRKKMNIPLETRTLNFLQSLL